MNQKKVISDDELRRFADNPDNKIEHGKCHLNVDRVYNEYKDIYKCEIYNGDATFITNGGTNAQTLHYWNVITNPNTGEEQVVDIYNYKSNKKGEYHNHQGECVSYSQFRHFCFGSRVQ